jgi:transposase
MQNFQEIIENQSKEIQIMRSELNIYKKRCEQYAQAYDQMKEQLSELIRNRFGKKSERFIDPENPQKSLFESDDKFSVAEENGNKIEDEVKVRSFTRKKKDADKKDLPIRIDVIPVSEEDMMCACGACKSVINYETKKLIHYQPETHEIIEQRREIVACLKGCEGEIITAAVPIRILPGVRATEEFLSFVIVSKLADRQPFYHLEKKLNERHGIDCSRQTMARWTIDLMFPLQPLWNLMKDSVIDYDIASCDATTLQVLREPGRAAETKSYVYCIRGGSPENAVILYEYNENEHKKFVYDWFAGFEGYLHVDGDNFFDLVGKTIADIVNCNAHGRRKFEPIAQGTKGRGLAKEAMRFFKELYKIEREAKNQKLTSEQRYELRQQKSKPLMEKFKAWLDEMYPTTLPQSSLGKAMSYCINRWPGLTRFLEDGRLEIDNNLTEQEIKPLVIARKNFLFCASQDGARALCMHMSFIRTAKLHGWDPYHYYVTLLKNIPFCTTVEDYEKLLPWNIKSNHIKQN